MRLVGTIVLGCVIAAASAAPATGPLDVVVFPAAPLQADGERLHTLRLYLLDADTVAPGLPTVRAAHGAVVGALLATPDGGVALRYRPPRVTVPTSDTLTVTLRGREARLPVWLEPTGRVRLTLETAPGPLFIGRGATTTVKVHVRDAAGRPAPAPLRVGASVGRVNAAHEVAAGEYVFDFTPPDERYPEVAIVAALSIADGSFAAAPIRLWARVTVEGEGEPGATMRIAVDGREFPATTIGADGRFSVPIVVPPGGRAVGVSVDALGNRQRRDIDLALPPFPRLLVGAVPSSLPADGAARAEVVAFAVDARGNPERRAAPALTADAGVLSPPTARGDGSTTWSFTAPAALGPGFVTLRTPGGQARLELRPGPPRAIEVTPPAEPLPAGSDVPVAVDVRVRDGAGSPVAGAALTATLAGGRVVGVHARGFGRYAVEVVPPRDPGRGRTMLHVEVAAVPPGPPRRVSLHSLASTDGVLGAEAWIDDDAGLPVADAAVELAAPGAVARATSDRYGTARIRFAPPPERTYRITAQPTALPGVTAALDVLVAGGVSHSVASVVGGGVIGGPAGAPDGEPPSFPAVDVPLALRPAAASDVRLSVDPQRPKPGETVRVRIELRTGDATQLLYEVSGGSLEVVRAPSGGAGELRFTPPADARPGSRFIVSVTDAKSHVTTFTEVQVQ
jgi:hypothetical protein